VGYPFQSIVDTGDLPNMITLTEKAVEKLLVLVKGRMLRVLVRTTGCSGLAYHLEFADKIQPDDHDFSQRGVSIVVDPKSIAYVSGCEIDYITKGLNEGFEFYNPAEKARCGCGESFTV
jgi:iron-sulfur cluster assembly protein|tara:strand:+ start:4275 stop:4631 length:357 start_codon:yes stop_codon:yes gene_type:complete